MKTLLKTLPIVVALATTTTSLPVSAVVINGPYFEVEYDESQDGAVLWGLPAVFGGSVDFTPNAFAASASWPETVGTANETIVFTLKAKDGFVFSGLQWLESGRYTRLTDPDPATMLYAAGQLGIRDDLTNAFVTKNFSASDLSAVGGDLSWDASTGLIGVDGLTQITLSVENDLLAVISNSDGQGESRQASIEKEFGQLLVNTEIDPEISGQEHELPGPPTWGLLLAGLAVLSRRVWNP